MQFNQYALTHINDFDDVDIDFTSDVQKGCKKMKLKINDDKLKRHRQDRIKNARAHSLDRS